MIRQAGLEDDPLVCLEMYSTEVCLEHITVIGICFPRLQWPCTVITAILYMRTQRHSMVQWLANSGLNQVIWVQFVLMYDRVLYELDHSTGEL